MERQHVLFAGINFPDSNIRVEFSSLLVVASYIFYRLLPGLSFVTLIGYLFIPTVHLDEKHDQYPIVISWVSRKLAHSRSLKLASSKQFYQRAPDDLTLFLTLVNRRRGKEVARFEPFHGLHILFHDKRLFFFRRVQEHKKEFFSHGKEENIVMGTLSFSAKPVKDLLQLIVNTEEARNPSVTLYTLHEKEDRRFRGPWTVLTRKNPRPLSTIILAPNTISRILNDMKAYLNPQAATWYSKKGIPYRRGYLFYGIPGSGKTSLASVLAGELGLDIYVLNLEDEDTNDKDLAVLFQKVPENCIVSIEDFDPKRLGMIKDSEEDLKKEDKGISERSEGVTLGGLLGALDGIAATERRILIISTNQREELKSELIRPGRIDMQIEFTHIKRAEMRQMFLQFYDDITPSLPEGTIAQMATKFANILPEGTFSTADIQGFLLNTRENPNDALQNVEKWRDETIEKKTSR